MMTDLEEKVGIPENFEASPERGGDCVGVGSKKKSISNGQRLSGQGYRRIRSNRM